MKHTIERPCKMSQGSRPADGDASFVEKLRGVWVVAMLAPLSPHARSLVDVVEATHSHGCRGSHGRLLVTGACAPRIAGRKYSVAAVGFVAPYHVMHRGPCGSALKCLLCRVEQAARMARLGRPAMCLAFPFSDVFAAPSVAPISLQRANAPLSQSCFAIITVSYHNLLCLLWKGRFRGN